MSETCCGCSLATGVRVIAMFDILLAFSSLLSNLFFDKFNELLSKYFDNAIRFEDDLAYLFQKIQDGNSNEFETSTIIVLTLAMSFATLDIAVSAVLLHGANSRNVTSCRWWLRLRVFLVLVFIVYFFVEMGRQRLFLYGVLDILLIFYRIYCLSTVDSFIRQLEKEDRIRSQRRNSIVVPHVQVITPDGSMSFSSPFPCIGEPFYPPQPPAGAHRINPNIHNIAHINPFNARAMRENMRDRENQARSIGNDVHPYTRFN